MGMIKEFKEFILKGNMIDMAVGIIIGAAFGLVVKSLVADVIMPPIGAAMGGVDFSEYKAVLVEPITASPENPTQHPVTGVEVTKDLPAVTLNYGSFINACITLVIQGFAIFLLIKVINKMKRKEEEKPQEAPKPAQDIVLLSEIRDLLKQQPPSV
ncbi:MAG: large-conductance mechanosensitive channel protein MscL [Planctomycetota bacterium]